MFNFENIISIDDGAGRLNKDFKNKLEGLFGGGTKAAPPVSKTGPAAGQGPRKLPGVPTMAMNNAEDHEYQELPEIRPDAVTYVNEQFNVDYDAT